MSGLSGQPLQVLAAVRSKQTGYKVLRLKCKGKCKFDQVLNLLAGLKGNPYYVGIEELRIQCDAKEQPQQRKQVDLEVTLSTFAR